MNTKTVPVIVKGKNVDVTPALENHVRTKVQKVERMFANHPTASVEAMLSTGKEGHVAEITFHVGGYMLRGESTTGDMYHSINQAMERIEGQLRKFKTKLTKKLREKNKLDAAEWSGGLAQGDEASVANDAPEIVRTKRFILKPMSVDEAVLQMELLGHDFFVFNNAETNQINVLYKRRDGRYGILEAIQA